MTNLDKFHISGIQKAINEKAKQTLIPDGAFGPKSMAALKTYQSQNQLTPTGLYDDTTAARLDPFIKAKYLSSESIKAAADMLGVTSAHVRAVCDVEAKNAGFLPDGRAVILFERHHFTAALRKKFNDSQMNALLKNDSNIVNVKPGGYYGADKEYHRFNRAFAIDQDAAIYATSWGLFQIMGFNYKDCGFADMHVFCTAMRESETNQLNAFVAFNRTYRNGILQKALRANDWVTYAKNYNGPNYAMNNYDKKLAAAFKTHQ